MKLGLGTVQFGLPYGVVHTGGTASQHDLEKVLRIAAARGVDCLDTAPAYGESETRLGRSLGQDRTFRIVTKTAVFDSGEVSQAHAERLRATFLESLDNLGRDRVYGLLVHHADDLLKPGGGRLIEAMQALQLEGLVDKIGVSVSGPRHIERVLDLFQPDIVQLPLSALDQRVLQTGHLAALKARGVEIHARSVFLQGLLLMPPQSVPLFFSPLRQVLDDFGSALQARGMTRLHGALAFVHQLEAVDYAVIGVQSSRELEQILDALGELTDERIDFGPFAVGDEDMILPHRWKL